MIMNIKKHIPNLITIGNLLCGTIAAIFAVQGDFTGAAIFVVSGIILDFFDGFAARLLNVSGELGAQLDSLADLVTGGLAPAFVSYRLICESGACDSLMLNALPALLVVAAAYRLARYNVSASEGEGTGFFEGLPAPAAGLFWMGMTLWWGAAYTGSDYQIRVMLVVASVGMVMFPLLMVIKRPFFGLKTWGKDKTIDAVRIGLGVGFIAVAIGTWIAWGNAYAAVSLCVLLYSSLALIFAPKDITS